MSSGNRGSFGIMYFDQEAVFEFVRVFDAVRKPKDHDSYSFTDARAKYGFIWSKLDELAGGAGQRIVDLGGGDLHLSQLVADYRGSLVVSIDSSRPRRVWTRPPLVTDMLGWASFISKIPRPKNVNYQIGDAISFLSQLGPNSVDLFIDACSVTHFNTHPRDIGGIESNRGVVSTLHEVYRTLKPGGLAIFATDLAPPPDLLATRNQTRETSKSREFLTPDGWLASAREAGLKVKVVPSKGDPWLFPPGGFDSCPVPMAVGGVIASKSL